MRRIQVTLAFAGLLLFGLAWSVAAPQQSKSSNKKSAVAAYGNADAITEDELKVYDYFLASDRWKGATFRPAAMMPRRCTLPAI